MNKQMLPPLKENKMADLISFTLRELKQCVQNFCTEHQFPIASTEHLIKVFDMVTGSANEKIFKN
jgi:hypothetical protein